MILRNTFINAQMGPIAQYLGPPGQAINRTFQIKWIDEASTNKIPLAKEGDQNVTAGTLTNHRKVKAQQVKSSIKGGKQ